MSDGLDLAHRWLSIHDELAPGLIEGLYLVGSAALGDRQPRSDVDIVAFTADPPTAEDAERLRTAHEAATAELAVAIDGPRLAWADVSVPPMSIHRPWSLDGEFHHDGDCFEINPVTWYTLARYGVVVRGEPADRLGVAVDADDRRSFVHENVDTYWRDVAGSVAAAIADPGRDSFRADTTEWCSLGIARMLYGWATADVASKTAAGEWATEQLPAHADVLRAAIAIRAAGEPATVDRSTAEAVLALLDEVVAAITGRRRDA